MAVALSNFPGWILSPLTRQDYIDLLASASGTNKPLAPKLEPECPRHRGD
jgi:hypothetical protein